MKLSSHIKNPDPQLNTEQTRNNNQRLFALAHIVSPDARSAAGKVDLIIRNLAEISPETEPSIRQLVSALEKLEFEPVVEDNLAESVSEHETPVANEQKPPEKSLSPLAPTEHTPSDFAPEEKTSSHLKPQEAIENNTLVSGHVLIPSGRADEVTREAARLAIQSRISAYVLDLGNRARFDVWVGVQSDLPDKWAFADSHLNQIRLAIIEDLTTTELRVYGSTITIESVRTAVRDYLQAAQDRLVGDGNFHSGEARLPSIKVQNSSTRSEGKSPQRRAFSFKRSIVYGLLIFVAAYSARWVYITGQPEPPERDIIRLSMLSANIGEIEFPTTSAEQAERYILDLGDTIVRAPEIEDASLLGVNLVELHDDLTAPSFVYEDNQSGLSFPVFAYSYKYIRANRARIDISPQILNRIEDASRFGVRMTDQYAALVWRHKDDILIAIIETNPDDLIDRISIL
jgi:hypothetical protein